MTISEIGTGAEMLGATCGSTVKKWDRRIGVSDTDLIVCAAAEWWEALLRCCESDDAGGGAVRGARRR